MRRRKRGSWLIVSTIVKNSHSFLLHPSSTFVLDLSRSLCGGYSKFFNNFQLRFHRSRKPKGEPKEKKSGDERLGAKQRRKIKSKAFVSSSEDSDSETEKLKIADV